MLNTSAASSYYPFYPFIVTNQVTIRKGINVMYAFEEKRFPTVDEHIVKGSVFIGDLTNVP